MKEVNPCKRGNISERNSSGHCLCVACKLFRSRQASNSESRKEYIRLWRLKNKEKVSGYSKKWVSENKEKRREIERSWKKRNPEKKKLYEKKSGAKWARENKGKRNAIDRKRKLAQIQRTPKWADMEKIKQFYIEAERLTKETGIPHEVDHIIPLQGENVSGLHVENNLQILTRAQNRSKKNKVICVN